MYLVFINLVTPKARAKHGPSFNKPAYGATKVVYLKQPCGATDLNLLTILKDSLLILDICGSCLTFMRVLWRIVK